MSRAYAIPLLAALACTPAAPKGTEQPAPQDTGEPAECRPTSISLDERQLPHVSQSYLGATLSVLSPTALLTSAIGGGEGSAGFEYSGPANAYSVIVNPYNPATSTSLTYEPDIDWYQASMGQRAFLVGDLNGDGETDAVITVNDAPQSMDYVAYSGTIYGPLTKSSYLRTPSSRGMIINDAAWQFTPCDVNNDGLSDLCSTRGIALAPPPFSTSSIFSDASPNDLIVRAKLADDQGLIIYQEASSTLRFIPDTALPPRRQAISDLATTSLPTTVRILALTTANLSLSPHIELIATVNDNGQLGVRVWALAEGLPELYRYTTTASATTQGALAVGHLTTDNEPDLAFASDGNVALLNGPLLPDPCPRWLTITEQPTPPEYGLGYSLAISDSDQTLYVGFPGYEYTYPAGDHVNRGRIHYLQSPFTTPN